MNKSFFSIIIFAMFFFISACTKESNSLNGTNKLPSLTTNPISEIESITAKSGGNILSTGGSSVTGRGVCWSTKPSPTLSDSTVTDLSSITESFTLTMKNLSPNTTYYVRAYATNSAGTAFGNELSFTTGSLWTPINKGIETKTVSALAIMGTTIIAGTYTGIYISEDNGGTWTFASGIPSNTIVNELTTIGDNVYAATSSGIFRSNTNGKIWNRLNPVTTNNTLNIYQITYNSKGMYAATGDGIFFSADSASSWKSLNFALAAPYIVYTTLLKGDSIYIGREDQVYVSIDNGNSWKHLKNGFPQSESVFRLATDGTNIYGSTVLNGNYVSNDNGNSWKQITMSANGGAGPISIKENNIYFGSTMGVFLSTNKGDSWTSYNTGLPANRDIIALVISGTNVYAGLFGGGLYFRPI